MSGRTKAPVIWWGGFSSAEVRRVKACIPGLAQDDFKAQADLSWRLRSFGTKLAEEPNLPTYLYFYKSGEAGAYKKRLPDLMVITGGYVIVSDALKSVISGFDPSGAEFLPLPLYENDQKTLYSKGWNLMNIAAKRDEVVYDDCVEVALMQPDVPDWYRVNVASGTSQVAVRASAADGPVLWRDRRLANILFVNDSLVRAVKDAGLKSWSESTFRRCLIVE